MTKPDPKKRGKRSPNGDARKPYAFRAHPNGMAVFDTAAKQRGHDRSEALRHAMNLYLNEPVT